MSKRILLGIDTNYSPTTQLAVRAVGEFMEQATSQLHLVLSELQKGGIAPGQIEVLIRIGFPADEIVKVAKELHVNFIVVGSHTASLMRKIQRFLAGSTSRSVLRLAPCPVMIVTLPRTAPPGDLVTWYEQAITTYLQEHTSSLTVFTPQEVAQKFVPPRKKAPGRKEIAAAALALEQLASTGLLCRHDVKGELRYVND